MIFPTLSHPFGSDFSDPQIPRAPKVGPTEAFPRPGGVPVTSLAAARGLSRARGLSSDAHLHRGAGNCRGHLERDWRVSTVRYSKHEQKG